MYIFYYGNLDFFSVFLRMALILTNVPKEVGLHYVHCWKSVNIRGIPKTNWKNSNVIHKIVKRSD